MADNRFRSSRGRDSLARDDVHPGGGEADDPLAELARMIGQNDVHGDSAAARLDWPSDDDPADPQTPTPGRYAAPSPPRSYQPDEAQERGYEAEPAASSRYFSGPAAKFNGFDEDDGNYAAADDAEYGREQAASPGRQLPAFMTAPSTDGYEADEQAHDGDQAHGADDYQDDTLISRRRGGLVVVLAVLGLAVLGTAGAFGYRAMFGHSMLPTLPPIIKASNGPNKIVPSSGDAQANNPGPAGTGSAGTAENLVPREEQPVKLEPPAPPRVAATIPVPPAQSPAPPTAAASATPGAAPPAATAALPAAQPSAPISTEPKKIHTVTIRADQSGNSGAAPIALGPTTRGAVRPASPPPKPSATAGVPPAGGKAPLSIVPGPEADAPPAAAPPRARAAVAPSSGAPITAVAPMSVASTTPVTTAANPSGGGGYAVQLTSQRSEADAQAAFQTLQAKFPNQLGGREPILRRADLGAKGVYYRALVGPFASMEEAAGMCSSLKAAGGNCIVQRN